MRLGESFRGAFIMRGMVFSIIDKAALGLYTSRTVCTAIGEY